MTYPVVLVGETTSASVSPLTGSVKMLLFFLPLGQAAVLAEQNMEQGETSNSPTKK
jgi:hypothetical protein